MSGICTRPRGVSALATMLVSLLASAGPVERADAGVRAFAPAGSRGGIATFHVPGLRAHHVRAARLRSGAGDRVLDARRVRGGVRRGVVRVRLNRGAGRRGVRLVVETRRVAPGPTGCAQQAILSGAVPGACWRPYGAASPFNLPLPASPRLMRGSRAIVNRVTGFGPLQNLVAGQADTANDYGHPTYYARAGDPLFTVRCVKRWGTCAVEGQRIRIPARARAAGGEDGHMTVVDVPTGWEYDLWQVRSKPTGGGTLKVSWGGRTRIDGDGLGSDATAARFGNLGGVIRAPELEAGAIDHALFMVVRCDSGRRVYPAAKSGRRCSEIGLPDAGAPPMGARFQLDMSEAEIAALPVPGWKKAIFRAMARYGMYFGDTGSGSWAIQAESGSTYTSFGQEDRLVAFARAAGVPAYRGTHVFNVRDGVDWRRRLRVIDPCEAAGTCGAR